MLRVTAPQTDMSATAEFYIVTGQAATLLGRKTLEMLATLKVGVNVMNCSGMCASFGYEPRPIRTSNHPTKTQEIHCNLI